MKNSTKTTQFRGETIYYVDGIWCNAAGEDIFNIPEIDLNTIPKPEYSKSKSPIELKEESFANKRTSKGIILEDFINDHKEHLRLKPVQKNIVESINSRPQPSGLPIIGCAECGDTYRKQTACVWTDTCTVHFRLYKDHGRYHTCTPCAEKIAKDFFKSNKMTTMPIIYNDYEIHLEFYSGSVFPLILSIEEMDTILRDFFDKGGQDYSRIF